MKKKPDISGFVPPRDPNAFLEGATVDRVEKPTTSSPAPVVSSPSTPSHLAVPIEQAKPEPTVQKIFRLRWDIANALKLHAAQQSAVTGRRVTETEIVERLLRKHLDI